MLKKVLLLVALAIVGMFAISAAPKQAIRGMWTFLILFGIILLLLALYFGFTEIKEKQWWE